MTWVQSKNMLNYVVCKYDGSIEIVPEIVGQAILEAKSPKIAWTKKDGGNRMLDLKLVSDLFTEEDYYKAHPDKRPAFTPEYKELPSPKKYTKIEAVSALQSMVKGLSKFCERNPNANKAKALLDKMKLRLEDTKKLTEKEINIKELIKF